MNGNYNNMGYNPNQNMQQPMMPNNMGQQPYMQNGYNQQMMNMQPQPNDNKKVVIIVILVILIVAVAGGIYFVTRDDSSSSKDKTEQKESSKKKDKDEEKEKDKDKDKDKEDDPVEKEPEENNNNNNNNNNNSNADKDWTSFKFTIDDKEFALPLKYSEFKSAVGLGMKASEESSTLENNRYVLVSLYDSNTKLMLYVDLINTTGSDQLYKDLPISQISQTEYMVNYNNAPKVIFPGKLTIGMDMTKAQLVNMYGTPNYEYKNDKDPSHIYETYTFSLDDTFTSFNYYKVEITNGKITTLTLDYRYPEKNN